MLPLSMGDWPCVMLVLCHLEVWWCSKDWMAGRTLSKNPLFCPPGLVFFPGFSSLAGQIKKYKVWQSQVVRLERSLALGLEIRHSTCVPGVTVGLITRRAKFCITACGGWCPITGATCTRCVFSLVKGNLLSGEPSVYEAKYYLESTSDSTNGLGFHISLKCVIPPFSEFVCPAVPGWLSEVGPLGVQCWDLDEGWGLWPCLAGIDLHSKLYSLMFRFHICLKRKQLKPKPILQQGKAQGQLILALCSRGIFQTCFQP